MWLFLLLVTLTSAVSHIQGYSALCDSECCILGGTCGSPVFDKCDDGTWEYRIRCSPSHQTCCLPKNLPTEKPTPTPKVPTTTINPGGNYTTGPPSNVTVDCGNGPHLGMLDEQIVAGIEAIPNSWPWMASLEFDFFEWNDWKHHCGGSVIDNQWILTAAHCIAKSGAPEPKNFRVVLGKHATNDNSLTGYEQVIPVEKLIVHELYDTKRAGSPWDIALVKLAYPVDYTNEIAPVCLPEKLNEEFTPDDKCYIIGFGLTQGRGKENVLNEVKILITPNDVCDDKWEKGSGRVNLIQPEHICAGDGVPGTCNGDSGGPLVCEKSKRWVLAGATSFGASGCTAEGAPDVYTRISIYYDWITEKLRNN